MNRRPPVLKLSLAIQGFLQCKAAEALSPRTIESYQHDLLQWLKYADDVHVSKVSADHVRAYLVWLRTDHKPRRSNGNTQPLSPKTIRNIWVSLAAFFRWFSQDFQMPNPMKSVAAPKFEEQPVEPYTKEQVESLLKACNNCREAKSERRRSFTMRRHTVYRDRALILMLLDTGLRASEICSLTIGDADFKSGKVQVRHGLQGGAKGGKGRTVYMGKGTRRELWRYLVVRSDREDSSAPLFGGHYARPINITTTLRITTTL